MGIIVLQGGAFDIGLMTTNNLESVPSRFLTQAMFVMTSVFVLVQLLSGKPELSCDVFHGSEGVWVPIKPTLCGLLGVPHFGL